MLETISLSARTNHGFSDPTHQKVPVSAQRETLRLEQQVFPGQGTEQAGEGVVCLLSLHAHRTTKYSSVGQTQSSVLRDRSAQSVRGDGRGGTTATGAMEIKSHCNEVNNFH